MTKAKVRTIIVLSFFGIFLFVSLITRSASPDVSVSNVSLGYVQDKKIILAETLPSNGAKYFVCGNLKAQHPAWLQIHVFDSNGDRLGGNDARRKVQPDSFCEELKLLSGFSPGIYDLEIINARNTIYKVAFEVR